MPQIYNAVVKGINQAEQEVSVTCEVQLGRQPGASYFHEVPPMA